MITLTVGGVIASVIGTRAAVLTRAHVRALSRGRGGRSLRVMAAFEDLTGAPAAPSGISDDRHSAGDVLAYHLGRDAFESSEAGVLDRLEAFPRFASKRSLARFLCRHELFKRVLDVNGAIVECGVFNGAGLFTWAQLANIFEPVNYNRRVIGFDTFDGFPDVSDSDGDDWQAGDLR